MSNKKLWGDWHPHLKIWYFKTIWLTHDETESR
jgi:hypothetical protein